MKKQILEWRRDHPVHAYDMEGNHDVFELDKSEDVYNVFGISFVNMHLSHLMGEVLTIAEAVIDDERKLKATKDLVRAKFSAKMSWLFEQSNSKLDVDSTLED